MLSNAPDITRLLQAHRDGDARALDALIPVLYDDLREIARRQRRRSSSSTLNTTAVVHEAWVKLAQQSQLSINDRGHFLALAARCMRSLLIDHARRWHAQKRGAGVAALSLRPEDAIADAEVERLLALDQALEGLGALDARLPRIVECLHFAGLTAEETGTALGIGTRTVERDWARARAWLAKTLA
jgi:RNA polymerase sigma factor (TIGR02999 family)